MTLELLARLIEQEDTTRFRLLFTKGKSRSWFVFGRENAIVDAQRAFAAEGNPVAVIEFPPGQIAKHILTIGEERKGKR